MFVFSYSLFYIFFTSCLIVTWWYYERDNDFHFPLKNKFVYNIMIHIYAFEWKLFKQSTGQLFSVECTS